MVNIAYSIQISCMDVISLMMIIIKGYDNGQVLS